MNLSTKIDGYPVDIEYENDYLKHVWVGPNSGYCILKILSPEFISKLHKEIGLDNLTHADKGE